MAKGKFKRSRWKPGNVYGVPLTDGSFGVVQAIVASPSLPGIVNVGVFDYRYPNLADCGKDISREHAIALLGTWRAEMNGGWVGTDWMVGALYRCHGIPKPPAEEQCWSRASQWRRNREPYLGLPWSLALEHELPRRLLRPASGSRSHTPEGGSLAKCVGVGNVSREKSQ